MYFSKNSGIIYLTGKEWPKEVDHFYYGGCMEEKLKRIEEAITKPMNDLGIVVDECIYTRENGYNFLKITIDKVNGLDIDQVVEATNVINPIIDELDLIDEEYILDISSKESVKNEQ